MTTSFNPDYYPTPDHLIEKMMKKVESRWGVKSILEPSAGSGNIVKYINNNYHIRNIHGIEKDPKLQTILRGRIRSENREEHLHMELVDSDFLKFEGSQHYDLIVANFPFSEGAAHLLKAIEIMFSGQIVCLVNAETIRNPCTNERLMLRAKLKELNADIEFLKEEFVGAERKTSVEVAMVHINIKRDVETHLYAGMKEVKASEFDESVDISQDIATRDNIANTVLRYNIEKDAVIKHIVDFYKNHNIVGSWLDLTMEGVDDHDVKTLTDLMKGRVNAFIENIKKKYWQDITELPEVKRRLFSKRKEEFLYELEKYSKMEFTESNIRQLMINLIQDFPEMVGQAVEHQFDEFTKYALMENKYCDGVGGNIHYFNAWKTNSGYKVNKKVIMPFYNIDWDYLTDKIDYRQEDFLNDMSLIADYFCVKDSSKNEQVRDVCNKALRSGKNRKIDTKHYLISIFKKGTIHVEFKDEDLLRRFNIVGCKRKGFLPMDYSSKKYKDMTVSEQALVVDFEGKKNYKVIPGSPVPLLNNFQQTLMISHIQ